MALAPISLELFYSGILFMNEIDSSTIVLFWGGFSGCAGCGCIAFSFYESKFDEEGSDFRFFVGYYCLKTNLSPIRIDLLSILLMLFLERLDYFDGCLLIILAFAFECNFNAFILIMIPSIRLISIAYPTNASPPLFNFSLKITDCSIGNTWVNFLYFSLINSTKMMVLFR